MDYMKRIKLRSLFQDYFNIKDRNSSHSFNGIISSLYEIESNAAEILEVVEKIGERSYKEKYEKLQEKYFELEQRYDLKNDENKNLKKKLEKFEHFKKELSDFIKEEPKSY